MRALDETRKSKRMYDALADIQKSIRVARHAHLYLDYHPEAGGKENRGRSAGVRTGVHG